MPIVVAAPLPMTGEQRAELEVMSLVEHVDGGVTTYSFTCPFCGRVRVKDLLPGEVRILVAGGMTVRRVVLGARPDPAAPTLTDDDVDAFVAALEQL